MPFPSPQAPNGPTNIPAIFLECPDPDFLRDLQIDLDIELEWEHRLRAAYAKKCRREFKKLNGGDPVAAREPNLEGDGQVTHDKAIASTFLTSLDPTATRFTFQTFDDNKDRKSKALARVLHGTLDECFAELTRLNNLGAGIFITTSETNFLGRSTKNIMRPRALFYDADGDEQVSHATTVIEAHDAIPSMTIISGGGRHGYYICDDIPLDQFSALQKSLAAKLGTDPAVHDLPRVMRLPGMLHLKNPTTPRLVKLVATDGAVRRWKLSDLIDRLGLSTTTPDRTNGRGASDGHKIKTADAFKHLDPRQGLGQGIENDYWYDRLQGEQKDEVVDYALEVIASKTLLFEIEEDGGDNDQWYRLTTAVARSGAPQAEEIFIKYASAAKNADPEDALREYFAQCRKNPRGITVGTLLGLASEHGADFESWRGLGQPAEPLPPKLILTLADWEARDLPAPDCILGDVLSTTTRMLLAADTGIGKTLFSLAVGMRCALGCGFLHWTGIRPTRVLYIDGEMSNRQLKLRLADEAARLKARPETFFALSREDIPGMQPLNTHAGQMTIEAVIREHCGGSIDLIQFDNIMALISGNHSEEEGWAKTMPWILNLTQRAIGQMWIHHTGHDTSRQYGTKTREWQMDAYAQLDKIERESTDVSFLLSFRKARERTPENRPDFANTKIALVNNGWIHEDASSIKKIKLSPEGEKYLECLRELTGPLKPNEVFKTVPLEDWRQACVKRGLIEAEGGSSRSLFSKYKRDLIAKNWIACTENAAWVMP